MEAICRCVAKTAIRMCCSHYSLRISFRTNCFPATGSLNLVSRPSEVQQNVAGYLSPQWTPLQPCSSFLTSVNAARCLLTAEVKSKLRKSDLHPRLLSSLFQWLSSVAFPFQWNNGILLCRRELVICQFGAERSVRHVQTLCFFQAKWVRSFIMPVISNSRAAIMSEWTLTPFSRSVVRLTVSSILLFIFLIVMMASRTCLLPVEALAVVADVSLILVAGPRHHLFRLVCFSSHFHCFWMLWQLLPNRWNIPFLIPESEITERELYPLRDSTRRFFTWHCPNRKSTLFSMGIFHARPCWLGLGSLPWLSPLLGWPESHTSASQLWSLLGCCTGPGGHCGNVPVTKLAPGMNRFPNTVSSQQTQALRFFYKFLLEVIFLVLIVSTKHYYCKASPSRSVK